MKCRLIHKLVSYAQCLKITEKVSFNIASEASYGYILSVQKLIKNAKNDHFWQVFENLKLVVKQCYQNLNATKIERKLIQSRTRLFFFDAVVEWIACNSIFPQKKRIMRIGFGK